MPDDPNQGRYTLSLRSSRKEVLRPVGYSYNGSTQSRTVWWDKDRIWAGSRLIAAVSRSDGIHHYHVDHLGSPPMVTNRCGQRTKLLDHNPWALERFAGQQDAERHRFTAHQRDLGDPTRSSEDLDYMHARYYNPTIARFVSVDPVRGRHETPQSLNLFAYVTNNVLRYVDPLGLQEEPIRVGAESIVVTAAMPVVAPQDLDYLWWLWRKERAESLSGLAGRRQRAQERDDPMLVIVREVGSLARDATPPCRTMSFGQKRAINMDKTHGGLLGFALHPSVDTAVKWGGRLAATMPAGSYASTRLGWPTLLEWVLSGLAPTTSGGAAFTGLETGVLALDNSFVASVMTLPSYAVGTSLGSAYQAWTAPCETFR